MPQCCICQQTVERWSPHPHIEQRSEFMTMMETVGSDLSIYSQDDLDAIALSLNTRPRETLGWKTPLAVYTEHMARLQLQADSIH